MLKAKSESTLYSEAYGNVNSRLSCPLRSTIINHTIEKTYNLSILKANFVCNMVSRYTERIWNTYRQSQSHTQRNGNKSQKETEDSTAGLSRAQPSWRTAFLLHSLSRLFCCKMLPKQMRQVAPLVLLRKGRFVSHILDFEEVLCSIIIWKDRKDIVVVSL